MYNIQKPRSIEQIAQCLDLCAGLIMATAGVYMELTFGDLFSVTANVLVVMTTTSLALVQAFGRYVSFLQQERWLAAS